jgi:hypothetical protein
MKRSSVGTSKTKARKMQDKTRSRCFETAKSPSVSSWEV